jgi:protein-disulfide isomerase
MKIQAKQIFFFSFLLCFAVTTIVYAQTSQAGSANVVSINDTLALVNEQSITLGDIDPEVQKLSLALVGEIAKVRKQMLEEQISNYLFEADAKLKRVDKQRYLYTQVFSKVGIPTQKQIQEVYELNREAFANADMETAKKQIVNYLQNEKAQTLLNELSARLRKTHKVVMGVDVNKPKLEPNETLASVDGRVITAAFLEEKLKPIIYDLRLQVYEAQQEALDQAIYNRLVLDEARKQNIGPEEIIRKEITEKFRYPTEDDIKKFYDDEKIKVPYADARTEIFRYLEKQEQDRLEKTLSDKLRATAKVKVFLAEPQAPVQNISAANNPARGDLNAAVTVVMFTDFQCPACSRTHPVLNDILKKYGTKIRFVVRDFPLESLHPQARRAAEAAAAANAQGKFFEYIELLYQNQNALDDVSLKKYASQVGLNRVKFDSDFMSRKFAMDVQRDYEDGIQYGIKSTPTIFVNGVRVRDLKPETIQNAIDRAFAQKGVSQK